MRTINGTTYKIESTSFSYTSINDDVLNYDTMQLLSIFKTCEGDIPGDYQMLKDLTPAYFTETGINIELIYSDLEYELGVV